jgi:hypothetical protein
MAEEPENRPVLVLNPPGDLEFRDLAKALIDAGIRAPGVLQVRLRERHPRAVVRPRDLVGEQLPVWYVYRDGRWVGAGG